MGEIMADQQELIERRLDQCPCKHVDRIEAQQAQDIAIMKLEFSHSKENQRKEIADILNDFRELSLSARECLNHMQQSAEMFRDGNSRMGAIEARIGVLEDDKSIISAKLGEPLSVLVSRWVKREKYVWWWVSTVTLSLVLSGYAKLAALELKSWWV